VAQFALKTNRKNGTGYFTFQWNWSVWSL